MSEHNPLGAHALGRNHSNRSPSSRCSDQGSSQVEKLEKARPGTHRGGENHRTRAISWQPDTTGSGTHPEALPRPNNRVRSLESLRDVLQL
jgi:hypothetical protein